MSYKITHFNVNGSEADFITSVTGDITYNNKADNEDLVNVDSVIKLADKEYSESSFSGLGRIYLRKNIISGKNILTSSMITSQKTIYIIQYDYDLNGQTINIPECCILDFQGGSFKNGILNGENYSITSEKYMIFNNISFTGSVIENLKFSIDWFVPREYTYSIKSKTPLQNYINAAFNSGVKNIEFSAERFYYITETITIDNKAIKLFSDSDCNWQHSSRSIQELRGCIHSDTVITLLDYNYKSTSNFDYTPYIGNLFFLCNKPYTTYDAITTPIVRFTNNNYYTIWGMTCNCNVYGQQLVSGELNYTGIEINTTPDTSLAFLTMRGNIQQTYYGVRLNCAEGTYFNSIDFYCNTRCVVGGVFNCNAVQVYGGHQPCGKKWATKKEWEDSAYFECPDAMISIYNYVWDLSHYVTYSSTKLLNAKNTVRTNKMNIQDNNNFIFKERTRFLSNYSTTHPYNIDKYLSCHNILNKWNSANKPRFVSNITYTINGENILTYNKIWLYNSHILFNGEGNLGHDNIINPYLVDIESAAVWSKEEMDANFVVTITLADNMVPVDMKSNVPLICRSRYPVTITLKSNDEVIDTITSTYENMYNFNSSISIADLFNNRTYNNIVITIEFTIHLTTSNPFSLPHILIPIEKHPIIYAGDKRPYFDTISKDKKVGFCYFDTNLGKPIWWNGSKWIDATGTDV